MMAAEKFRADIGRECPWCDESVNASPQEDEELKPWQVACDNHLCHTWDVELVYGYGNTPEEAWVEWAHMASDALAREIDSRMTELKSVQDIIKRAR